MATTPYMGLTLPDVSITVGPTWATEMNAAMTAVDAHDHTNANGVRVPVAALNINADLDFQGYNIINMRSVRMTNHAAALAEATDLACLFAAGGELYYRDASGNSIQLTASGALNAASVGGIGGDYATSTASVSYSSTSKTFTFTQAASTPALIDCGTIILRRVTASGAGITIEASGSLVSPYTITLPSALPAGLSFVNIDATGAVGFGNTLASLTLTGDLTLSTCPAATANVVSNARTRATGTTVAAGGVGISSSCLDFGTSSSSFVDVTNLSVTITTTGRPVFVGLISDGVSSVSQIGPYISSSDEANMELQLVRDSTAIAKQRVKIRGDGSTAIYLSVPSSALSHVDVVAAGTYTYKVQARQVTGQLSLVTRSKLLVYEL